MGRYEITLEDGSRYEVETEDAPAVPDTSRMTRGEFDSFQDNLDRESAISQQIETDPAGAFTPAATPEVTGSIYNTPLSKQDLVLPYLGSVGAPLQLVKDGMTTIGGMTGFAAGGGPVTAGAGGAAGGAVGSVMGDFALQGIDNLYNFIRGRQKIEPSNPVTPENLVTGAVGGMFSGPAQKASSAAGEAAGSFLDDVGVKMRDIAAPSRTDGFFGPSNVDQTVLADPQVKRALGFMERNAPENLPGGSADNITRVGPNTQKVVEGVQNLANMGTEGIGAPLGAMSGDTGVVRALSDNFYQKAPAVEATGVFQQAKDVPELIQLSREGAEKAYADKRALADELAGVIDIDVGDFANEMGPIRERINKLKLNGFNDEFVAQIESTLEGIMDDIGAKRSPGPLQYPYNLAPARMTGNRFKVDANTVSDMLENINEYRRKILREFESGNVAARSVGDEGRIAASREALEALVESQSILKSAFDKQLQKAALNNPDLAPKIGAFQNLLDQYGGFQAVEELANQFHHGTLKGLATRDSTRIVQNLGAEGALNAFNPNQSVRQNVVSGALDWAKRQAGTDPVLPGTQRFSNAASRDVTAMDNVRDIMSLRSNPATLPGQGTVPSHPDLGMTAMQSARANLSTLPQNIAAGAGGLAADTSGAIARGVGDMNPVGVAASGMVRQSLPALHDDGRPPGVQMSITPSFTPDEMPGNIPRHIGAVDARMIGSLLTQFAGPQDVMPLAIQASRVFASKDQREIARFLGAVSEKYPDMPFERGPVTGLPSEFQMDDGSVKLFSDLDVKKWSDEIERSPLREDEKAQRLRALYTDGTVFALDKRLNDFGPPLMVDDSMQVPPEKAEDLALKNLLSSY